MNSLRRVAARAAPTVEVDQVRKALHSFPSTSGAGRSGLRPSHIRGAMRLASADLLLSLSEVVHLLLLGQLPELVHPYVCGASIMALRKPNGSLQPIAIGETIRRLTSKVAVDLITDRARGVLEPLQLGVKTPNGCEAAVHRSNPDKVALSLDVSNAFNTVHRSAVLQEVRTHFPSIAPWVDCCYRHESTLFTGSSSVTSQVIASARGVQQGDLLRPVLFALAIHPVIKEARQAAVTGCVRDPPRRPGFRRLGLEVNLDKTEVIPACTTSQSFGPANFHVSCWNRSANFKLLGAAVGTPEWCEDLLGRRVAKARALLAAIGKFPDAQGAFCLLRSCFGWAKVLYSCRTVPPDSQPACLRTADTDMRAAMSRLVGRPFPSTTGALRPSATPPARSASGHAPVAYVASFSACRDLCSQLSPAFDPLDLDDGCHLSAAENSLRAVTPPGANIYAESDCPR